MSIETCTMPRSVIRARSVIMSRSAIRAWTILFICGVFISLRKASAGTRNTCVASSAMAVAMRGRSAQRGDFAKLLARPGAAGDAVTSAFFALDHHASFQHEERVLVRLALAQQHIARRHIQHRKPGRISWRVSFETDANCGRWRSTRSRSSSVAGRFFGAAVAPSAGEPPASLNGAVAVTRRTT